MRFTLPLACALVGVSLLPSTNATNSFAQKELFPTPASGITIPALHAQDGGWSLEDLVREYERTADVHVLHGQDCANLLDSTPLNLVRGAEIPADKVHTVVQTLLAENGWVFGLAHEGQPTMFTLRSRYSGNRHEIRMDSAFVPYADLSMWEEHPGFTITTAVPLQSLAARQASNTMRSMVLDNNTQMIQAAGDGNTVMLTGLTTDVMKWVKLLEVSDAETAALRAKQKAEAEEAAKNAGDAMPR